MSKVIVVQVNRDIIGVTDTFRKVSDIVASYMEKNFPDNILDDEIENFTKISFEIDREKFWKTLEKKLHDVDAFTSEVGESIHINMYATDHDSFNFQFTFSETV